MYTSGLGCTEQCSSGAGGGRLPVLGWGGGCEWFEKFSGFEFAAVKSDV